MKKLIVAAIIVMYSSVCFSQGATPVADLKPMLNTKSVVKDIKRKGKNIKIVSRLDSLLKMIKKQQRKITAVTGSMKNKNKK